MGGLARADRQSPRRRCCSLRDDFVVPIFPWPLRSPESPRRAKRQSARDRNPALLCLALHRDRARRGILFSGPGSNPLRVLVQIGSLRCCTHGAAFRTRACAGIYSATCRTGGSKRSGSIGGRCDRLRDCHSVGRRNFLRHRLGADEKSLGGHVHSCCHGFAAELETFRCNLGTVMLKERALAILHEWVQSESLRRHCYAVADSMKQFAQQNGADADLWEAVGLLHDMDYERHPNQEQSPTEGHPFVGVAWLREQGWSEEVCRAILSHADYAGVSRETPMERTLYAVDELSSFVLAVALVRPTKSIHDVDVRAVKKKMKDKAFARAVNRDDIIRGAEHLGMPLDDVIAQVIDALKGDAERLGLVGMS